MNRPSFVRDLVGVLVGGIVAAVAAGLVFLAFHPIAAQGKRPDHPAALMWLAGIVFLAGASIGRRGISAEYYSDVLRPVIGIYLIFVVFCLLHCFGSSVNRIPVHFTELAVLLGEVTAGVIASVVVSLLLLCWFPVETDHDDTDT